jgi:hypothetical protein
MFSNQTQMAFKNLLVLDGLLTGRCGGGDVADRPAGGVQRLTRSGAMARYRKFLQTSRRGARY